MSPRTVRVRLVQGERVQLGAPFRLPQLRWGYVPPRPVEPVRGQLAMFGETDEDASGPAAG